MTIGGLAFISAPPVRTPQQAMLTVFRRWKDRAAESGNSKGIDAVDDL